nr:IMPACT family member in pol 5'region-like [Ipomoea batatas]
MHVAAGKTTLIISIIPIPLPRLSHHRCYLRRRPFLILSSPIGYPTAKRPMVTASSSSSSNPNNQGAFTTIEGRFTYEKEIKKSKFIAIAGHISDQRQAESFLSEVVGDQYRSNDDGEPSGTAGKPIHSAIVSSGLDRVMVVVIRHFGGIKLGTGGLVRAYGGTAAECLRNAPTQLVKSKVPMGVEVPFDLIGVLYHQLQTHKVEDIKQDYDTGKGGVTMVTFKVDFDRMQSLEEAIKTNCSRDIAIFKR